MAEAKLSYSNVTYSPLSWPKLEMGTLAPLSQVLGYI